MPPSIGWTAPALTQPTREAAPRLPYSESLPFPADEKCSRNRIYCVDGTKMRRMPITIQWWLVWNDFGIRDKLEKYCEVKKGISWPYVE